MPDHLVADRRDEAEVHRLIRDRLVDRDQRYTSGRRSLIDILIESGAPLTLPELLDRAPGLSQSSAYRNLAVMEEAGVVRRLVHRGDHAHYELAEDLTEHHHHLICESCGAIWDVTLGEPIERSLDSAFDAVARAAGFTARHHAIDVYGVCADCRATSGTRHG